jgi:hypothetical protein
MANLIFSELSRIRINKQSRFLTLLNKVKALDTFPLTDEAKKEFGIDNVVLEPTPEFVSVLEDIINKQQEGIKIEPKDFKQFSKGNSLNFPLQNPIIKDDKEIKTISSSALLKTNDFGGDENKKSITKELIAYGQLNDLITNATDDGKNSIDITVIDSYGKAVKHLKDVTKVIRTQGSNNSPISDFEILNKNGQTICYISHKWGTDPSDFGQYTGVSEKRRNKIYTHPEAKDFVNSIKNWLEDISNRFGDGSIRKYINLNVTNPLGDSLIDLGFGETPIYNFPPGITIGKVIRDPELKRMAMFGQDIVDNKQSNKISSTRGHNAVDFLAQGKFSLENKNNDWQLKAYKLISSDMDIGNVEEAYEPIFVAKYDSSRRDVGIQNCRVLIYTKEGRTVKQYVNETK